MREAPFDVAEYNKNSWDFKHGRMSLKEWEDYCMVVTGKILEANKDVLIRLKEGGD